MNTDDKERVELYVSCRQLKDSGFGGQTDSRIKCYQKVNGNWQLIGQTEIIEDNLDPNFTTSFVIDFIFEVKQPIMFEVLEMNKNSPQKVLGTVETTVGKVMGARGQTSVFDLKIQDINTSSSLVIVGEKATQGGEVIIWQWKALNLMNTDGPAGKSDPFLRFFRKRSNGEMLKVYETEVISDNLNPIWKPFEIVDKKLCNDHNTPFRIECWDWEKGGKYQYIGDCQITLNMLKNGTTELQLKHPQKNASTGTLKLAKLSISQSLSQTPSFIDYIRGGTQLNVVVAIDFTASNGEPTSYGSLHEIKSGGQLNEYQQAINAVCQIILNYDYDQLVPVYGFGGKPRFPTMTLEKTSHCFPCSGVSEQHQVSGLEGIMDVYTYALKNVELSGPTYFAPLITEAMKACEINKKNGEDIYTILLILTDGEIHDMDKTIDAIIQAAQLPLSIIIIGLGYSDFDNMQILDGDKGLKNSRGEKANRDLVQFVPFKEFDGNMENLAQKVLAEVPDQLVGYMKMAGKSPKAPQIVDRSQIGLPKTNIYSSYANTSSKNIYSSFKNF